jgi:hypothetical protein
VFRRVKSESCMRQNTCLSEVTQSRDAKTVFVARATRNWRVSKVGRDDELVYNIVILNIRLTFGRIESESCIRQSAC